MHSWSQITQIFFFKKGDIRHNKHTLGGSRRRHHADQAAAADGGPRRGEVEKSHRVGGQDCHRRPSGVEAASSVRTGATVRQEAAGGGGAGRQGPRGGCRPAPLLPAQADGDPRAGRHPCTPAACAGRRLCTRAALAGRRGPRTGRRPCAHAARTGRQGPRADRRACTPAGRRGPRPCFRFASEAAGESHGSASWGCEITRYNSDRISCEYAYNAWPPPAAPPLAVLCRRRWPPAARARQPPSPAASAAAASRGGSAAAAASWGGSATAAASWVGSDAAGVVALAVCRRGRSCRTALGTSRRCLPPRSCPPPRKRIRVRPRRIWPPPLSSSRPPPHSRIRARRRRIRPPPARPPLRVEERGRESKEERGEREVREGEGEGERECVEEWRKDDCGKEIFRIWHYLLRRLL
ncbi:hypothetical protein PVAP13_3NG144201 [Panicum virgatum]|uniref:Uncharacterized protein n=1 Tax=Panicum virgatum TaxID=38727 RepID=A0A8T0U778_PANVG|nr:hypothetical protein PVAP13_3NG144201 [Panicum virgatum]